MSRSFLTPDERRVLEHEPPDTWAGALIRGLMHEFDARLVEGPTRQDLEDTIRGGADRYTGPAVPRVQTEPIEAADRVSTRPGTLFE